MPESADQESSTLLVCEECGARSPPDARGWQARLLADENGPLDEVAMFRPECVEREVRD
jgi:hypothetical protein